MTHSDGHGAVSLLVLAARFLAYWVVLSVGFAPLALVLGVLGAPGTLLVGGANLGLAAIAIDRDVGLRRLLAFSLTTAAVFFLSLMVITPIRADRTAPALIVVATVAYAVGGLVGRAIQSIEREPSPISQ